MRKIVGFIAIGMLVSIPFIANAALLGTGELHVKWSTPTSGGTPNYYADYDGTVVSSTFGYTTDLDEIFCVSKDRANDIEFVKFYTITPDLDALLNAPGLYAKLAQAAWIADNWTTHITATSDQDKIKAEAQKAVWKAMGVTDQIGTTGTDYTIYNEASGQSNYLTTNWYYAHSPLKLGAPNYQDYLTPAAPIPEPATILLLGSSLIGIAGLGRRKLFKK